MLQKNALITLFSIFHFIAFIGAGDKPNIVFFLVDDMGVKDLACYGSDFYETSHIDQLAKEGMRFTNAYASHPVCGPSRSAIVTGKFPVRLGLVGIGGGIPKGEVIWPKVLKDQGYTTYFTGKWHMGGADSILKNGFDYNVAGSNNGQPGSFYYPYEAKRGVQRLPRQDVKGMEDGEPGDYLTDKLTDKALRFLDQHGKDPFLLYFSYYNVHKPYVQNAQGKKEHTDYFKKKLSSMPTVTKERRQVERGGEVIDELLVQRNAEFASQIKTVDDSVGKIMSKLKELKVSKNTIVIFTTDQSSMCTSSKAVSSSQPYSFGKSFAFDGGIRVPFIVRWPENIKENVVNKTTTISTDIYPTLLDMLDLDLMPGQHQDGISLSKTFDGSHVAFDRTFYWTYPSNHSLGHKGSLAVRQGPYKLIYWSENNQELYNIEKDVGENNDLSTTHPEVLQAMVLKLEQWKPAQKHINKLNMQ